MNILIPSIEGVREYVDENKPDLRLNSPVFLDWVTRVETSDYAGNSEYMPHYIIRFSGDHFHIDWNYETKLIRDDRYKEILEHFKNNLNAKTI